MSIFGVYFYCYLQTHGIPWLLFVTLVILLVSIVFNKSWEREWYLPVVKVGGESDPTKKKWLLLSPEEVEWSTNGDDVRSPSPCEHRSLNECSALSSAKLRPHPRSEAHPAKTEVCSASRNESCHASRSKTRYSSRREEFPSDAGDTHPFFANE